MEAGAIGISFGLMYSPGATRDEVLAASKVAAEYSNLVGAHGRYWGNSPQTLEGVQEFIQLSRESGISVQYSHLGSMAGYGEWMDACISSLDEAQSEGLKISCDTYPYLAGMGNLGSAAFDDGVFELRNSTPSDYEVPSDVIVDGKLVMRRGDRFTQELWNLVRPLVLKGKIPDPRCIGHAVKPEKVKLALLKPYVMIGSDGRVSKDEGGNPFGHPRVAGTHSKFLGQLVREERLTDLMTALSKCSTLPAQKLGLKNKGRISEGADADVTIFDANSIIDRSTFGSGFDIPPSGIEYVIVNGVVTIDKGEVVSDVRPGQVLLRSET